MADYVPGTKIPKPKCELVGGDGNAFSIMGRVVRSLKRAGVPKSVIETYQTESMSGDYDNLLRTAIRYVDDCGSDYGDDD